MRPITSLRRDAWASARPYRTPSARVWRARLLRWFIVLAPLAWGVYQTLKEVALFLE